MCMSHDIKAQEPKKTEHQIYCRLQNGSTDHQIIGTMVWGINTELFEYKDVYF